MSAKIVKCMDMCVEGKRFVCKHHIGAKRNPYKLYEKWYDGGWHQKKIIEYQNFISVLDFLRLHAYTHNIGFQEG